MSSRRQLLVIGAALGLIAGLLLGAGAVLAQGPQVPTPAPIGDLPVSGLPATGGTTTVGVSDPAMSGGGVAQSGSAIAYPYFGGTPGIAPEHTIVVTGVGQADLNGDGSDRVAAQKTAIGLALADAKAQADAIATATGLSIGGVLSVSASVSPNYAVMPMMSNGSTTTVCPPIEAPAKGGALPQPICPPIYQPTIEVSVTVAYRVA